MVKIVWDNPSDRTYEAGLDHGVLYYNGKSVPWNGLVSISESPEGFEHESLYIDGIKYHNDVHKGERKFSITAFTYPDLFDICLGNISTKLGLLVPDQVTQPFNLSWRTLETNTMTGKTDYKIHLLYNAYAIPTQNNWETINDTPNAATFSWDIACVPIQLGGYKPSAKYVLDSSVMDPQDIRVFEEILYGTTKSNPSFPDAATLSRMLLDNNRIDILTETNGLYSLKFTDGNDLIGSTLSGIYSIQQPLSRLTETANIGIYKKN